MQVIRLPHDSVNCVFTTDWHLSDTPPGRRTGNYREEILAKVKFCSGLAHQVNGIGLFGGDLFHSKNPRSPGNTFALQTRLEYALRLFPNGTLYGTHGNHDVWMDRTDSIPSQPIGALIASGALTDISNESIIFENNDGSVRVQVDAYPYADDMVTLDRVLNAAPREAGVTYRVVLMHQYGNPGDNPTMFEHPIIGFNQMAGCDYDMALWGHDHSRTDTVTVGNTTHVRLGSLSRASLAMDEVDRPVCAAVISFKAHKIGFKEVPIPVKPLEIAFTAANNEVERVRQSDEVIEFFKEMDTAVTGVESTDPRTVLRELCPADEPKLYDLAAELCGL